MSGKKSIKQESGSTKRSRSPELTVQTVTPALHAFLQSIMKNYHPPSASSSPRSTSGSKKPKAESSGAKKKRCGHNGADDKKCDRFTETTECSDCGMDLCSDHYYDGVCKHCIDNADFLTEYDNKKKDKAARSAAFKIKKEQAVIKKQMNAQFKQELAKLKAKYKK